MSRIRFTLAVCALVATVSACQDGGSVTGPDRVPGGARYNGGWMGTGHFIESTDTVFGTNGIGMIGSGHYVEGDDGVGGAGSGHYVAGGEIGMGGSGGASATSAESVSTTLSGIGMAGSGH